MLLGKVAALLLIAALANPLCCCLGIGALAAAPTPLPAEHACCGDAGAEADKTAGHSDEQCPHLSEKSSKIWQTADSLSALAKTLCHQPALDRPLFAPLPPLARTVALLPAYDAPDDTAPVGRRVSQSYCVYRL